MSDGQRGRVSVLAFPKYRHSLNPYTANLYRPMEEDDRVSVHEFGVVQALLGRFDILHLHWVDPFVTDSLPRALVRSLFLILAVTMHKIRGGRLFWTPHNLKPHENPNPRLQQAVFRFVARHTDVLISLTEGGLEEVREAYPVLRGTPAEVIPHGHYIDNYPITVDRDEARSRLGIPEGQTVILSFGIVRRYKKIPDLLWAVRDLGRRDLTTIVAGQVKDMEAAKALDRAEDGPLDVRAHRGVIAPEEVQLYFLAADLVVLPASDMLNSGSAMLALSFGKPVLGPAVGSMLDLKKTLGPRWVRFFSGDAVDANDLEAAVSWCGGEPRNLEKIRGRFDPVRLSEQLKNVYLRQN